MQGRAPDRIGPRGKAALFLAVFSFFLLTGSRERPFADATPIWEVAESIVRRMSVSIRTPWPPEMPRGRGGRIYAVAPLMQSLVHVPGAWGRWALGKVAPASAPYTVPFFSHLAPAALGALTCLAFFLLAGGFVQLPIAAGATGVLAVGTYLWVYARSPYSEVLQTACFVLFFLALLRTRAQPDRRHAVWLGVAAGALAATKLVYIAAVLGGAAWLAWYLLRRGVPSTDSPAAQSSDQRIAPPEQQTPTPDQRTRHPMAHREILRLFGWAAAGVAPFALMVLAHNWARWGSPLSSGYAFKPTPGVIRLPPFGENVLVGLWGLFLSPGKSLFLYSPPLLLGVLGLPRLYRRAPEVVTALALTVLPVVLVYSRLLFWAGDYAWGPRYLVFLTPVLLLPAAVLVEDLLAAARTWWRRLALASVALVIVLGVAVQALGISFIWDHHIRITREAGEAWLGTPNRSGAAVPEREGLCGACFEDMHRQQWLPPFSPIDIHRWLLRHIRRGDDWQTAEADAPWHRYTTLTLDASHAYHDVRLDWWFYEIRLIAPALAVISLLLLCAATAWAAWRFLRALVRPSTAGVARINGG